VGLFSDELEIIAAGDIPGAPRSAINVHGTIVGGASSRHGITPSVVAFGICLTRRLGVPSRRRRRQSTHGTLPGKRYSPAECIGAVKHRIEGNPDPKYVSTSFAERSNLSQRMHNRRFTRLTNAFSKKVGNHAHSVALFAMYYNFVRIHKTLRTTPAMAAGVTSRLWEIGDIVDVLEAWEAVGTGGI
jgi:hypothetical protein